MGPALTTQFLGCDERSQYCECGLNQLISRRIDSEFLVPTCHLATTEQLMRFCSQDINPTPDSPQIALSLSELGRQRPLQTICHTRDKDFP